MDVRLRGLDEQPALAQVADDLIGGLDGRACRAASRTREEAPALVDRREHRQVVHLRQLEVLGAAPGAMWTMPGALLERDVVPRDHAVHDPLRGLKVVERPFVFEPDQLGAADPLEELAVGDSARPPPTRPCPRLAVLAHPG